MHNPDHVYTILIIGGGAGGLELATRLGRKYAKDAHTRVTLVDQNPTYIWKPLWHELAAGTLNAPESEVDHLLHSYSNGYRFELGCWESIDRQAKRITLAPIYNQQRELVVPRRELAYDILVIAVGSISNDFGVPGVAQHCETLDSQKQADAFHQRLLQQCMQIEYDSAKQRSLQIAIVGGGATGVELAAELHDAFAQMARFGWQRLRTTPIELSLIEAAPRLLAALPERTSHAVQQVLQEKEIAVYTDERVVKITAKGIHTASGKFIPANLCVWAAGIKAPEFLSRMDGLDTNKLNQIHVGPTLQMLTDPNIFALGDCAYCEQGSDNTVVPPKAQAAHQQAQYLMHTLPRYRAGRALPHFRYRDRGSLITLSRSNTVGYFSTHHPRNVHLEGRMARFFYWLLYKSYQRTLLGTWRVTLLTLSQLLNPLSKLRLKLH